MAALRIARGHAASTGSGADRAALAGTQAIYELQDVPELKFGHLDQREREALAVALAAHRGDPLRLLNGEPLLSRP